MAILQMAILHDQKTNEEGVSQLALAYGNKERFLNTNFNLERRLEGGASSS